MIRVQENIMNTLSRQSVTRIFLFHSLKTKFFQIFLSTTDKQTPFSITAEQLRFLDQGYFETYSLAWLEHALKVCYLIEIFAK